MTNAEIDADVAEYVRLLDNGCHESVIQRFLGSHTYFFNGLARLNTPIYSRVKLGADYEPDFAFYDPSSYGVDWYFVEIESPQQKMFNKKGDVSAALSHAMDQVRDWQGWIHRNLSYARNLLPLIEYPFAYIFIGRRAQLNEQTKRRLRRLNYENRQSMEIRTLDLFVELAESVKGLGGRWGPEQAFSHAQLARRQPAESFAWLMSQYTADYKEMMKNDLLEERDQADEKSMPSD